MERSALVSIIYLGLVWCQWKAAGHLYLEETDNNLKWITEREKRNVGAYL